MAGGRGDLQGQGWRPVVGPDCRLAGWRPHVMPLMLLLDMAGVMHSVQHVTRLTSCRFYFHSAHPSCSPWLLWQGWDTLLNSIWSRISGISHFSHLSWRFISVAVTSWSSASLFWGSVSWKWKPRFYCGSQGCFKGRKEESTTPFFTLILHFSIAACLLYSCSMLNSHIQLCGQREWWFIQEIVKGLPLLSVKHSRVEQSTGHK